jgi:hypothetical protein
MPQAWGNAYMDPAWRQKGPKLKNYLVEILAIVNHPLRKFTDTRVHRNDVGCKTCSVVTVWNAPDQVV